MTQLYHGSLEIVTKPEIRVSNRTLDYGNGFYTTTNYNQAEKWVLRHKNSKENISKAYVNIYEIDMNIVKSSNTLWFNSPTEEWVDFVYANRNDRYFSHEFDFVYGPVANDKVYAAFALFEAGILNKQDLIKELKTYTLVDQLLFHTETALKQLTFLESKEIIL